MRHIKTSENFITDLLDSSEKKLANKIKKLAEDILKDKELKVIISDDKDRVIINVSGYISAFQRQKLSTWIIIYKSTIKWLKSDIKLLFYSSFIYLKDISEYIMSLSTKEIKAVPPDYIYIHFEVDELPNIIKKINKKDFEMYFAAKKFNV